MRMLPMTGLAALTAAAFALSTPGSTLRAADLNPAAPPEGKVLNKPSADEMEARLKALERRVQELEAELKERAPQANNNANRREQREQRGDRAERDRFEAMLREQLRQIVPPNMDEDFRFGNNFGGPNLGFDMPGARKPRLGVELAPTTDELRNRFHANADAGAFVMSVVPGSPAERANLAVGDAITEFNGKPIAEPADLIDAVRAAPEGKQTITVNRKGTQLVLNAELGADQLTAAPQPQGNDGWLRRDGPGRPGNAQTKTMVRASALELPDSLAKLMNLNAEQRDKMSAVLDKHAKALSDEAATPRKGGHAALSRKAEDHANQAAAELKDVLSADQLTTWEKYRAQNNSVSVQQSTIREMGNELPPQNDNF